MTVHIEILRAGVVTCLALSCSLWAAPLEVQRNFAVRLEPPLAHEATAAQTKPAATAAGTHHSFTRPLFVDLQPLRADIRLAAALKARAHHLSAEPAGEFSVIVGATAQVSPNRDDAATIGAPPSEQAVPPAPSETGKHFFALALAQFLPTPISLERTVDDLTVLPDHVERVHERVDAHDSPESHMTLRVGPVLVHPSNSNQEQWWTLRANDLVLPLPNRLNPLDNETDEVLAQDAVLMQAQHACKHSALDFARLSDCHWAAADALHAASIAVAATMTESAPQLNPPRIVMNSGAIELAVWFECADARQVLARVRGETSAADTIVRDAVAMAKRIAAHGIEERIGEKVPSGISGFASWSLTTSWPTDSWELIACAQRLQEKHDHAATAFAALAARVGTVCGLLPSVVAVLEERLRTVAANLAPGFEWSAQFEKDCEAHLKDAFREGAMFGDVRRFPWFEVEDPVVGAIYAQTVAWEIYGYSYAQPNTLLPSAVARRSAQHASLMDTIKRHFETHPEQALAWSNETQSNSVDTYAAVEARWLSPSNQWKPWLVFDTGPEQLAVVAEDIIEQGGFDAEGIWWSIETLSQYTGEADTGARIFNELYYVFWDGYVLLRTNY
jgi:hypothetical protein